MVTRHLFQRRGKVFSKYRNKKMTGQSKTHALSPSLMCSAAVVAAVFTRTCSRFSLTESKKQSKHMNLPVVRLPNMVLAPDNEETKKIASCNEASKFRNRE